MDEPFLPPRAAVAHLCEGGGLKPLPQEDSECEERTWEQVRGERPLNSLQPVAFALDVSRSAKGSAVCTWGAWTVAVSILGLIPLVEGTATTRQSGKLGDYVSLPARQDLLGFEVGVRYMTQDTRETVEGLVQRSRRVVNETNDDAVAEDQRRQRLPAMLLETLRSVVNRTVYGSSVLCVTALVIDGEPADTGAAVCALNALSLALGRAGIQTRGCFGAAVGYIVAQPGREPTACLDLSEEERARVPSAQLTSCLLCVLRGGAVLYLEVHGRGFCEPWSNRVLRLVCNACEAVSEEIRTCLEANADAANF